MNITRRSFGLAALGGMLLPALPAMAKAPFSGAQAAGSQIYPVNTTSGLLVNLATDATASSLNNWGWQNGAYWLAQPFTVTFPATGTHTLRIQVREDGVQLDQIVLSSARYLTAAPGTVSNDNTIVPKP